MSKAHWLVPQQYSSIEHRCGKETATTPSISYNHINQSVKAFNSYFSSLVCVMYQKERVQQYFKFVLQGLLGRSSGVLVQKRSQSVDRYLEENRRNQQEQNDHQTANLPRYERGVPSLLGGYGDTPSETGYPPVAPSLVGPPPPPHPPPNYSTLQAQATNNKKKKNPFGRTSMPPLVPPPPSPPQQQYTQPSQYPTWDPRWAKEQNDAMKRVQREQEKMLKLQQKEAQRQMKIQQVKIL